VLHKVSLEGAPPDVYGMASIVGGTDPSRNYFSLLARSSSYSPLLVQTQTEPLSSLSVAQSTTLVQNNFILVIDDSPTVRKILETCLQREGFQVICFEDGIAAMQWLFQYSTDLPALIILDVNLPKMNGYEVARFLKMKPVLKETILIMLTRHDGIIDRMKRRLCGAQAYLSKPFETQTILAVVTSYLGVPSR
jgi:twitching motility two-component system response regulator PilG